MDLKDLHEKIEEKYRNMGENPEIYLKGLLQAKPVTYWDYIEVDTLLSLQKPKTNFKDESIFIMYHQMIELVLKMMLHEITQIVHHSQLTEEIFTDKISRLNRYTDMLILSFKVMREGMSYDDYNVFRHALAPASGFQSAQFRLIELYCTRLENLINEEGKKRLPKSPTLKDYFEQIYWKDAGLNRETNKKTLTLSLFEEKYEEQFMAVAEKMKGKTMEDIFLRMPNPSNELKEKLKSFDKFYNIEWPLVHLNTARYYLDSKGENKAATGGSEWKKYLHPHFQQRKFFPSLWSADEIHSWAEGR